ncbi:tRNA(Ile)-lysidine synthase [Desulfonatronum thiosulfatophilum]|uniref:tRNA(Ile)-lysidine synthase n=1 Tax=Desulfonatronum thiosulfatophilum TaxID=617002 RepID=A0A1G6ESP2_9BACT|nr:tRNA lysidine(34) synthetase TilS [Desulfonatronum thiosulfatophilum]SDB60450.1 tRNA(Ile)-lysidine synthase [Desulfonatronum thiosulfatophilum]
MLPPNLPARIQDLPPVRARFCLGVERFLLHKLALPLQGRHVVLACSAGSDSLALLLIMHCLASRLNLAITVAHLDHSLRPESIRESHELAQLCSRLNRPVVSGCCNVGRYARKSGIGLEEAGRVLRYRFLSGVRHKVGADYLFTAHHADDLAEDVLMRLIRGVGWPALSGMAAWDPGRCLVRPLLHTPKNELRDFLRAIDVSWSEDAGNTDPAFTRNRIRNTLIPLLTQENPRFSESITRLHDQGTEDASFFATQITPLLEQARLEDHFLQSSLLSSLHTALRLRLYKAVLDDLGAGQTLHDTLRRLDHARQQGRTGTTFQFPGEKTAVVRADGVHFCGPKGFPTKR